MMTDFAGRHVVVMGLGRFGGGIGVTRWLAGRGARVTVTDAATAESLTDSVRQLSDLPVTFHLGGHDLADLDACDLLVISPAVPRERSDFVQEAMARGIPLSSEMNLFLERCPARRLVGITGSAGKSTTTAMLGAMLDAARSRGEIPGAWMGGNIGRCLLGELDQTSAEDIVVLELSSFQLENLADLRFSPPTALITNIQPNHLDRHGTLEAYADAKMNILRFQGPDGTVYVHEDQEDVAERVAAVGAGSRLRRYGFEPAFRECLQVPGRHNEINAAGAIVLARGLGLSEESIREGLAGFAGLPHRLEFVAQRGGVRYYNDSKSTVPSSTELALAAFDCPVVMMVGGRDKGMSFEGLARTLAERAKGVVCYGATADVLYETIIRHLSAPDIAGRVCRAGGFEEAVEAARQLAGSGDVVVLSPACASYDMFINYEERGETFARLVRALP